MNINKWIKTTERILEEIKKIPISEDRLTNVSSLVKCHTAIVRSVNGWGSWLRNSVIMEGFNREELKDLVSEFKKMASDYLSYDIEIANRKRKDWGETRVVKVEKREKTDYIR